MVEAMTAQAEALPFLNLSRFASMAAADLADSLVAFVQNSGHTRVFLTRGVSRSVESAVTLAE